MPKHISSKSKQPLATKSQPRSPFNRSPYREKTLAVRVPESMIPQVRKMLDRRRDETARQVKTSTKPAPSVGAKVSVKAKPKLRR